MSESASKKRKKEQAQASEPQKQESSSKDDNDGDASMSGSESDSDSENDEYERPNSQGPVTAVELAKTYQGLDNISSFTLPDGRDVGEFKSHKRALHILFLLWRERSAKEAAESKANSNATCSHCDQPAKWKSIEAPSWRHDWQPDKPKTVEKYHCDECYKKLSKYSKKLFIALA